MLLIGIMVAWDSDRACHLYTPKEFSGAAGCYIYVPEGGEIEIDCNDCHSSTGLLWRDWFVLLIGVGVIAIGVFGGMVQLCLPLELSTDAAVRQEQTTVRVYAYCMMCFAFVVGLTCILTALELPVTKYLPS